MSLSSKQSAGFLVVMTAIAVIVAATIDTTQGRFAPSVRASGLN